MADTLIKRVGGKSKLADWIRGLLPYHAIYIEPFGGSFAVGFSMPRANGVNYRLVYNDLDKHISNFFRVLRDHPEEMARRTELTPYSRADFDNAIRFIEDGTDFAKADPIEWARNYLIYNRQSIFGKETGNWCVSRHGENICLTWAHLPPVIIDMAKRLKEVYVECDDYKNVIRRWDSEQSTVYADPPYLDVETDFYHVNKKGGFDHEELASELRKLKGSWAVSYYDSPAIRKLYEGCEFYSRPVKKHMMTGSKSSATELLIVRRNKWATERDEPQCFEKTK